jgi:hypothetical protein
MLWPPKDVSIWKVTGKHLDTYKCKCMFILPGNKPRSQHESLWLQNFGDKFTIKIQLVAVTVSRDGGGVGHQPIVHELGNCADIMYILFNLQKNYLLYFLYMETEAQGV